MGKLSRTKGHSFEREISKDLRLVFPEARRLLEYHSADANGVDIQNTGNFYFQCKREKKLAQIKKINEVVCDRDFGDIPVLVTKGDGTEKMVALYFEDFLDLLLKLKKAGKL